MYTYMRSLFNRVKGFLKKTALYNPTPRIPFKPEKVRSILDIPTME